MEDERARAIADHRHGAGRVADLAGKELARDRDVHLWNDVVIGGGLVDDSAQHCIRLDGPAEPPVKLGKAQIDEQEFLALVPIFENRRIGVGASDAAEAARSDLEEPHPFDGILDDVPVADYAEIDDRDQRSVDVVLDAALEGAVQFSAADEGGCKSRFEQGLIGEGLAARSGVAGTPGDGGKFAHGDDGHGRREGEMLLVLLALLPDRGVGSDDSAAAIRLRIGHQGFDDEVPGGLVQRAAKGCDVQQRGVVVPAEIFAEHPERFAPIVEFDVGAALLGEEGLLAAVAEVANHRNLVIGIVDLGAHLAGRPGIEIGEEGRARLPPVAHANERRRRPGHVAHPRCRIDVGQRCDDQAVAVSIRAVGLTALRDAEHGFALPPEVALLRAPEMHGRLCTPELEVGKLAIHQPHQGKAVAPADEFADRRLGIVFLFERDQCPG
ncbi:MAG TPA: hypothetical protein VN106_04855 [Sphingomicrobium sp.]|nr:hypothetical protein [Sphingomicrobium sp.]